jgi:hypothetical protein
VADQHLTDPKPDGDARIGDRPVWFCPCGAVVWDRAAHAEVSQTLVDVVEAVRGSS